MSNCPDILFQYLTSTIASFTRLYNIESAFWYPADEILGFPRPCANALCQKKKGAIHETKNFHLCSRTFRFAGLDIFC